jgi:pilus assembly protein CpaE
MPTREPPAAASRRAIVISPSAQMRDELDPHLKAHLASVPLSHLRTYPSPKELMGAMGGGTPHLVFLDVDSDREQAVQLMSELTRLAQQVQVIALLSGNDPDYILRCLRAGAAEFLVQPFTGEQMEAALSKLARMHTAAESQAGEPARMFAVMPAKGACGATTIACNLAYQWKRLGAKRILLADLDPLTGTLSFMLKTKSIYSFMDALQRSHELDADLWDAMVNHVNGVDVLLAPEMMTEGQDLRDPSPILDYARHNYDVIVLDASGVYGEWNLNQARQANELLLVTTNELPALQAAQRALSYLDTNRIGRWKIRLLVNRYLRDVGLSREVIGTALHTDVFDIIPSDYEAVQKALIEGKPIASNTPFGKSMVQLADRLGAPSKTAKKGSSLGGLFGLFSKTTK